jgi:endonuclease/exonuclease/phosphatase (EEP) superfamily protein YafD
VHGHPETVVRYTYHVKSVDWMADPQARQVFPVADRIIRHQGNLLMSATVELQDGKWMPVLPGQ